MTRGQKHFAGLILAAGVIALVVLAVWVRGQADENQTPAAAPPQGGANEPVVVNNIEQEAPDDTQQEQSADADPADREDEKDDAEPHPVLQYTPKLTAAEAVDRFEAAAKLIDDGKAIAARTALSAALLSGHLSEDQADRARQRLTDLAERTLFSSVALADDPYTGWYTFKPGDVLAGRSGVVRQLRLRVPERLIVKINNVGRAQNFQAGRKYKIIYGPFHAIVHMDQYRMDLILQREDIPPVFVARVSVGLGKNGSTPVGLWRVGDKQRRPTWYPPPNSDIRGPVRYNESDYAFGEKALWIAMEGADENTRNARGYGIHSTDEPDSVGGQTSLGCIRLRDDDIERVYSLLYPVHSVVETRR